MLLAQYGKLPPPSETRNGGYCLTPFLGEFSCLLFLKQFLPLCLPKGNHADGLRTAVLIRWTFMSVNGSSCVVRRLISVSIRLPNCSVSLFSKFRNTKRQQSYQRIAFMGLCLCAPSADSVLFSGYGSGRLFLFAAAAILPCRV